MNNELREFSDSEERASVLMICADILKARPEFVAYYDGIFDFEYEETPELKHYFSIITDDTFTKFSDIDWILDRKRVLFFEYRQLTPSEDGWSSDNNPSVLFRPLVELQD